MNLRLMLFALVTLGLILAALLLTDRPQLTPRPAAQPEPAAPAAPGPPTATEAPERGAALAQAGERALAAKDPKAAVRLLEEALKESPYNARWADLLRQAREQLAARARDPRPSPSR